MLVFLVSHAFSMAIFFALWCGAFGFLFLFAIAPGNRGPDLVKDAARILTCPAVWFKGENPAGLPEARN